VGEIPGGADMTKGVFRYIWVKLAAEADVDLATLETLITKMWQAMPKVYLLAIRTEIDWEVPT
jgi:hypothetical protein